MLGKCGAASADKVGPWSEEKLELLGKFMWSYSTIMNNQRSWLRGYYYIDAFAGSGQPKAKDTDEDAERYIAGSPLRALQTSPPFDGYWFIDRSSWRIEQLHALRDEYPASNIRIEHGDCNLILRRQVAMGITRASRQRGLVFLDPYGLQVEWETVEALARAGTLDIFVNFPIMGITRLLKRDEYPEEQVSQLLNRIMGSSAWVGQTYRPAEQMTFVGDQLIVRDTLRAEWLASLYAEQLGHIFPYVSEPVIMRNRRNGPLYALCVASHKQAATKIANDIFGRHERFRAGKQTARVTPSGESELVQLPFTG